jgi:HEPN domain-containing protein
MSGNEVRAWLEVFNHDIDTVRILLKEKGHADIIIYHIHQAVEKLLKAVLVKNNAAVEKIHRLDKLLNKAIAYHPELNEIADEVLEIDFYMPKLRYPAGEHIEFDTAVKLFNKYQKIEKVLLHYADEK